MFFMFVGVHICIVMRMGALDEKSTNEDFVGGGGTHDDRGRQIGLEEGGRVFTEENEGREGELGAGGWQRPRSCGGRQNHEEERIMGTRGFAAKERKDLREEKQTGKITGFE